VLAAKDLIGAAERFEQLGDHLMRARCVSNLAEILHRQGHRVQSKEYFKMAAQIALEQGNLRKAGGFLFRYACHLGELREFQQQKAILFTLLEADWLTPGQRLDIVKMLCLAAKATGEDDELKTHLDALLEILDNQINCAKSGEERRRLILSKGHTLEELEQNERALECYRRGVEVCERANDRSGLIEAWWSIGQTMGRTKRREQERQAYEKILSLVGEKNDDFHFPMALTMLAQLDIMEGRFEDARARLDRAEQENEQHRNPVVFFLVKDLRDKLPPTGQAEG
jgi:tetratricopeptide (TPR) repeat protein